MNNFNTWEEFFDWYISQIEVHVPEIRKVVELGDKYHDLTPEERSVMNEAVTKLHAILHQKVPLTIEEQKDLSFDMKIDFAVPSTVKLVHRPKDLNMTFASWFNRQARRIEIIYPTVTRYLIKFRPVIDAAIKHEMGHILNKDIFLKCDQAHANCLNVAQDVRINAYIQYDHLRMLTACLYTFQRDLSKVAINVPEELLTKLGMPVEKDLVLDYKTIHTLMHMADKEKLKEIMDALQNSLLRPVSAKDAQDILDSLNPRPADQQQQKQQQGQQPSMPQPQSPTKDEPFYDEGALVITKDGKIIYQVEKVIKKAPFDYDIEVKEPEIDTIKQVLVAHATKAQRVPQKTQQVLLNWLDEKGVDIVEFVEELQETAKLFEEDQAAA